MATRGEVSSGWWSCSGEETNHSQREGLNDGESVVPMRAFVVLPCDCMGKYARKSATEEWFLQRHIQSAKHTNWSGKTVPVSTEFFVLCQ